MIASASPLRAGRDAPYILGSMTGILALALLLLQPVLAAGLLAGYSLVKQRRWHRWIGGTITTAVLLHIAGLYITSPDDLTDALLLVAPTAFSVYGVIGLWAVLITAILAVLRKPLGVRYSVWRIVHSVLAAIIVVASVVHALMIEGLMGSISKFVLCMAIVLATASVLFYLRSAKAHARERHSTQDDAG